MRGSWIGAPFSRLLLGMAVWSAAALMFASNLRAEDDDLTIGDWYRLAVQRGGVTRSYEGTLIQASDHWLVLNAVLSETNRQGVPYLMDLPGAGKWFGRSTTVRADIECWIPIEAVSIEKHRRVNNPGAAKSLDVEEPPTKRSYAVDMIAKGNLVTVQRDLLKTSGDELLLGPANGSPTARENVNRADVVSLRFSRIEKVSEK